MASVPRRNVPTSAGELVVTRFLALLLLVVTVLAVVPADHGGELQPVAFHVRTPDPR